MTSIISLADIFTCLLDLSLAEEACLSKVSMQKQGKPAQLILSRLKYLAHEIKAKQIWFQLAEI
jgi:hypothetical protein